MPTSAEIVARVRQKRSAQDIIKKVREKRLLSNMTTSAPTQYPEPLIVPEPTPLQTLKAQGQEALAGVAGFPRFLQQVPELLKSAADKSGLGYEYENVINTLENLAQTPSVPPQPDPLRSVGGFVANIGIGGQRALGAIPLMAQDPYGAIVGLPQMITGAMHNVSSAMHGRPEELYQYPVETAMGLGLGRGGIMKG